MKKIVIPLILFSLIALFSFCQRDTRRNIILISVDTLRADHLGCYGYPRDTSPGIDALAREGVVFRRCYAPSSWTLPSHMTMLSSLYPSVHRVTGNQDKLNPDVPLISERLKNQGYATAAFVNGGYLRPEYGYARGFDLYDSLETSEGKLHHMLARVKAWLENPPDRPFFLFIHCYDAHEPYDPPPPYKFKFIERRAEIDLFLLEYAGRLKEGVEVPCEAIRKFLLLHRTLPIKKADFLNIQTGKPFSDETRRIFKCGEDLMNFPDSDKALEYLIGCYDGGVHALDREVEALFTMLRQKGVWDDSMIIFTSDHGEEFVEHGGLGHGYSVYQETVQCPLIIKFPGKAHGGKEVQNMTGIIDILPTILDYFHFPAQEKMQGHSLLPLLEEDTADLEVYAELSRMGNPTFSSIRTNRWSYIWSHVREEGELYYLPEDPGEMHNVIADNARIADAYKKQLLQFDETNKKIAFQPEILQLDPELKKELAALGYMN